MDKYLKDEKKSDDDLISRLLKDERTRNIVLKGDSFFAYGKKTLDSLGG